MPVARHRSPDLKWSFDLPDRLKIAIADAIVLYSRIESCCVEIIWELEQADLERKKQIAKAWGDQNFRLLKNAVDQIPRAKTDKIWPSLKALTKERSPRNLVPVRTCGRTGDEALVVDALRQTLPRRSNERLQRPIQGRRQKAR